MADKPTVLAYEGIAPRTYAILAAFEAADRNTPPARDPVAMEYSLIRDWIREHAPHHGKFLEGETWRHLLGQWVSIAVKTDRVLTGTDPDAGRGRGRSQSFMLTALGRWVCRLPPHPGAV